MKLNLLPTYVSKGAQGRFALVGSLVFLLACIGLTVAMVSMSSGRLADARTAWEDAKPPAEQALKVAQSAETIAALGTERKRNIDLATAMDLQNRKYTTFYDAVKVYIPSYMRVNAMSVVPVDDKSCRLNITGVIKTYQQYADVTLNLLRIPGALNVSRAGYEINDIYVPGLIETDQRGLPYRLNDGRKPPFDETNPDAQMQYLIEKAREGTTGFTGTGGFGTAETTLRRAMPEYSEVNLSVLLTRDDRIPADKQLNYDFRTPNPRATLASGAAPAGPNAGPSAGAAPDGRGAPGGLPPGAAGRPSRVAGPEDGS